MGFWRDLKARRERTGYGAWLITLGVPVEEAQELVRLAEKRDRTDG